MENCIPGRNQLLLFYWSGLFTSNTRNSLLYLVSGNKEILKALNHYRARGSEQSWLLLNIVVRGRLPARRGVVDQVGCLLCLGSWPSVMDDSTSKVSVLAIFAYHHASLSGCWGRNQLLLLYWSGLFTSMVERNTDPWVSGAEKTVNSWQ